MKRQRETDADDPESRFTVRSKMHLSRPSGVLNAGLLIVVAFLAVGSSGCLYFVRTTGTAGSPITEDQLRQIIIGETTPSDALRLLGPPHSIFHGQVQLLNEVIFGSFFSYTQNRVLSTFDDRHYALLYKFGTAAGAERGILGVVVQYQRMDIRIRTNELLLFFNRDTDILEDVAYHKEG